MGSLQRRAWCGLTIEQRSLEGRSTTSSHLQGRPAGPSRESNHRSLGAIDLAQARICESSSSLAFKTSHGRTRKQRNSLDFLGPPGDQNSTCRATNEQTIATLYRADVDRVLSYCSTGASAMMNYLRRGQILMVAEGRYLFGLTSRPSSLTRPLPGAPSVSAPAAAPSPFAPRPDSSLYRAPPPGSPLILAWS